MRRLAAPVFVLLVLAFVTFAVLVMASVAVMLHRGDPTGPSGAQLTIEPWQLQLLVAWLLTCGATVVGGSVLQWRKRRRRGVRPRRGGR